MNLYGHHEEDDDEWDDDDEDPADDSNDEPSVPCPFCSSLILEDSPWCPHCERYLSAEDHAGPGKPLWVFATALVCLAMAVWWIFAAL